MKTFTSFFTSFGLPLLLLLTACSLNSTNTPGPGATTIAPPTAANQSATPAASQPAIVKLNLNTATADDFLTIPNLGNRMVREFLEYRPYTSLGQFRREIGKYVDAAQVAAYEQYVFVPVDINAADADTLQQIPGVDATVAAALIAGRPYAAVEAFVTQLAPHLSAAQAEAARLYLVAP